MDGEADERVTHRLRGERQLRLQKELSTVPANSLRILFLEARPYRRL